MTTKEEALKILKEQRSNKVKESIDKSTERAAAVLGEIIDSDDVPPIVRIAAAKDILDRGGHKPVDKKAIAVIEPITGMKFLLDDGDNIQDKEPETA